MSENNKNTVGFAKAIADDTRQRIMELCCGQSLCVGEIVDALGVTQPTISHHLKILKTAGLVESNRKGKQIFYVLNQDRFYENCCQLATDFAPDWPCQLSKPS